MASVEQVWEGLQDNLTTALTAAGASGFTVQIEWPQAEALKSIVQGQMGPLITIYDQGKSKNTTRFIGGRKVLADFAEVAGGVLTPLSSRLASNGGTVAITGSGTVLVNDSFIAVFTLGSTQILAEYQALTGDTLTAALTGLTAAINALAAGFAAVLSGNIITITNSNSDAYLVRSIVVNRGSYFEEPYREERGIQIVLWTQDIATRKAYGEIIKQQLAILQSDTWLPLEDGTVGRVMLCGDQSMNDLQLPAIYRRDYFISVDYPTVLTFYNYLIEAIQLTFTAD